MPLPRAGLDRARLRDRLLGAVRADDDFLLTIPFVEAWEKQHGRIEPGNWVLLRTDWSKRNWRDYANLADDGAHTPGPDAAVMRWLVKERGIIGFGTETIGTDAGQGGHFNPPYPAHHFLHGGGRYGLQCLTNLDQLLRHGRAMIVAAPLKIEHGSGSPLRVLAPGLRRVISALRSWVFGGAQVDGAAGHRLRGQHLDLAAREFPGRG